MLSGAAQDLQLKTQHFPLQLAVSPVRSSKVSLPWAFTHSAAPLPESLFSLLRISLEVKLTPLPSCHTWGWGGAKKMQMSVPWPSGTKISEVGDSNTALDPASTASPSALQFSLVAGPEGTNQRGLGLSAGGGGGRLGAPPKLPKSSPPFCAEATAPRMRRASMVVLL